MFLEAFRQSSKCISRSINKSDRINALRKQYDAFLDEDKKRKERNDFILGRLEKMRLYSPAVVPVHHSLANPQVYKYQFIPQERPEYLKRIRFDDSPVLGSRQTTVLPDCVLKEEQRILQEISKNYILIPKLRSMNGNSVSYYNPSSVNDDGDWRNKYNILNELKKIEKEEPSEISKDTAHDTFNNGENSDPESIIGAPTNIREQNNNINRNSQVNNDKVSATEFQSNTGKTGVTQGLDLQSSNTPLLKKQDLTPNTLKNFNSDNEVVSQGLHSINQENLFDVNQVSNELYSESKENSNYNQVQDNKQNETEVTDNIVPTKKDQVCVNVKNASVTENNTVELQKANVVDRNIKVPLTENGNINQNFKTDEIIAHSVENIGQSEQVLENIQQQEYEPKNETALVKDNIIPSQIDEFEAEQKEMFYSEETGYDQNVDTMGYNTQNAEYTNEEYPYYNESQQEQPYYAEVNEHEESTERYDPNYEQQYVENYEGNVVAALYDNQQYVVDGYENQQEAANVNYEQQPDQQGMSNVNYEQQSDQPEATVNYEQQPLQYEYEQSEHVDNLNQSHTEDMHTYDNQASEHVNYETQQYDEVGEVGPPTIPDQTVYENQQDYVQMDNDQETIQNLEEQLDNEEGYTETQNTDLNVSTAEVENINETESNIKVP